MNPPKITAERGSTLLELLAVMTILGILSAIGMPAFLGQSSKGQDAKAKTAVRAAATAAETYFTDTESYEDMDADALRKIEPSLNHAEGASLSVAVADSGESYTLSVKSKGGNTFSIARSDTSSATSRTCSTSGRDGCPASGVW
jgi:prepilin-type N-terminal cleavage/methylation domain-containing protein